MSKGIILTQSQIKAHENGATMFIFPILENSYEIALANSEEELVSFFNIQKGDKNIFVQENFATDPIIKEHILYESNFDGESFEDFCEHIGAISKFASQMTKEQSRYSFAECIDVKVVKVQYIVNTDKILKLGFPYTNVDEDGLLFYEWLEDFYNQQLEELNINITYEDNDYVFLVEFA